MSNKRDLVQFDGPIDYQASRDASYRAQTISSRLHHWVDWFLLVLYRSINHELFKL